MQKQIPNPTLTRLLIFGSITTIIIVALSTYSTSKDTTSLITTPEATRLYDPAQYGVPDTLGGYKVLAVLTSQDVACMPSGRKSIVLQASEPNVHEYLESPKPTTEIRAFLRQVPGEEETNWQVGVVGPSATLETILSTIESWNSVNSGRPCRRLGGVQSSPSPP